MAKIPVKFNLFAAAFDDQVAKERLCESSGSEYSSKSSTDLSDLVNSFLERDVYYGDDLGFEEDVDDDDQENVGNKDECESNLFQSETKDCFKRLFTINGDDDDVKRRIHVEVEKACLEDGSFSNPNAKRRLMTRLRDRGLNAGLCKTKWEKNDGYPSGSYEYIDVKFNGCRYIVEVSLAREFEIARPTSNYTSLMEDIPTIFVGKVEDLKKIVKLICRAIKISMKSVNMHVPPWRKLSYMQAKWFGSYKRTINEVSTKKKIHNNVELGMERSIGFVPLHAMSYFCREDFGSKVNVKVGYLAAAFNGSTMML